MVIKLFARKFIELAFGVTVLVSAALGLAGPSFAQDSNVEVAFAYPEEANIPSFSVVGCTFLAPAATGAELIYSCPVQSVYEVSFKNWKEDEQQTWFGVLQVRPDTFADSVMIAPLHLVAMFKDTKESATADFDALAEAAKPVIIADTPFLSAENENTTGAKTVAAAPAKPEPEPDASDVVEVKLSWSASYGSLQVNWDTLVPETDEANGMINGVLRWDPSMRSKFVLSSNRSENCSQIFSLKQLQDNGEVAFDCEEQVVTIPFELALGETACRMMSEGQMSCLTTGEGQGVAFAMPDWKAIDIAAGDAEAITLADLMPEFPADIVAENVTQFSQDQCTPKKVSLHLGGYCQGDLCDDLGENQALIGSSGYLPDLASIGWAKTSLPTGANLVLKETTNDGSNVISEAKVSFPIPQQALRALFNKAGGGGGDVPLTVSAEGDIYKFGRVMKVFEDNECSTPAGSRSLNLANPGNRVPDVPQCSFYRIFDGSSARSSCTQIEYDAVANQATADLAVDGCGKKRLVVLVSENETMNGIVGQSIVSSLLNLATRLSKEEKCLPVDIVRASGEKREILLSAEDIKFAEDTSKFQASVTMSFVNGNSEILRDFEWVNRKWDRTLSGLIAVVDGDNATPTSMVDSPASMAWKIEDKYRSVINFGASKNCNVFQDVLLYDSCTEGDAATFEAVLTENIEQGLARLQAE